MQSGPATAKQLSYLRWLAEQTGTTFTPPRTVEEASGAIKQLRARRRASSGEIAREQRTVARDMATRRGDAAQVTQGELSGYGASATWAGMTPIAPRVVHCRDPERARSQARPSADDLGLG